MTTRTITRPEPSFITCNPQGRFTQAAADLREHTFTFWCTIADHIDHHDDFKAQIADIALELGMKESTVEDHIIAVDTFRKLPKTLAIYHQLRHLSVWHMVKIAEVIYNFPPDRLAEADDILTTLIQPTRHNQQLPPPWRVAARLREKLGLEKITTEPPQRHVRIDTDTGYTQAGISPEGAIELRKAVTNIAASRNCTQSEAFEALIRENTTAKITLNLLSFDGKTPIYLDGYGDLNEYQQRFWASRITTTRDLKGAENLVVDAHDPTGIIAVIVRLRDGHCAYPDCHVKAEQCQLHHVIEHELGGPTTVTNLVCLCQRHHNMVTSGNVRVFMRHWGQTEWFFPSGLSVTNNPDGPLADNDRVRWMRPYDTWLKHKKPKYQPAPPPEPVDTTPWNSPPEGERFPHQPPPADNTGWWSLEPAPEPDSEATPPPDPNHTHDTTWQEIEPPPETEPAPEPDPHDQLSGATP